MAMKENIKMCIRDRFGAVKTTAVQQHQRGFFGKAEDYVQRAVGTFQIFYKVVPIELLCQMCIRDSSFAGGKGRIYAFFMENHTDKEKVRFLKDEYGIGGRSHALSGATHSGEDHRCV